MKWLVKAMTFKILSFVPAGEKVHHGLQKLTGSTVQTEDRLIGKVQQTARYWQWLERHTTREWLASASHLDFGPGWLPSVPVTLYALGAPRQYLVDIHPHMKAEAVVQTIELFRAVAPRTGVKFARMPEVPRRGMSLAATLEPFGMIYAAPYDELTKQIAGTVGYITATYMLFHLDRATLVSAFKTIHHLLQPGGYFLSLTHLRQLFDGLDSRSSPFFALRYSDWFWENVINSRVMSYNRLKAPDYAEMLKEAGFEIAQMEVEPGRPEDFAELNRARIHPALSRYSRDDLAARHLFIAARKPT